MYPYLISSDNTLQWRIGVQVGQGKVLQPSFSNILVPLLLVVCEQNFIHLILLRTELSKTKRLRELCQIHIQLDQLWSKDLVIFIQTLWISVGFRYKSAFFTLNDWVPLSFTPKTYTLLGENWWWKVSRILPYNCEENPEVTPFSLSYNKHWLVTNTFKPTNSCFSSPILLVFHPFSAQVFY